MLGNNEAGLWEAFCAVYTDDPVNWIKWAAVFAVLILGYVAALPIYKKVSRLLSRERLREKAQSQNHMLEATLIKKHPSGEPGKYSWHATYRYFLEGEERRYRAFFKEPMVPPLRLYLYYVKSPRKLFSCEEYRYENYKALILFPLMVLPWILAVAAMFLLKIERGCRKIINNG